MVYFPTEDFADSIFIIVNVGLYYLFLEQQTLATDKALKDEFASHLHTSRINLETGLANMSLFMSVKVETVQALIMGVRKCILFWHKKYQMLTILSDIVCYRCVQTFRRMAPK